MKYHLPSLNALRAFEAAARHGNLSRAADELCVTPGAISRHVAILEGYLGCALLIRQHRGVTPTETGRRYLAEVAAAFDQIDRASRRYGRSRASTVLSVRLFPTISTEWLPSRLGTFRALHPDVQINLSASLQPPDFNTEEIDVAMMFGPGDWPSLHSDILFRGSFTPVCTPALLADGPPLESPGDLRRHNLLYSPLQVERWQEWLALAGVEDVDTGSGLRFESSSHAYHAARQGAGIALGQTFFLIDDLQSGRIVAPFDLQVDHPLSYCLVCPRPRREEPMIAAFRAWMIGEVEKTKADTQKLLQS